jgi:hypothetical protein
MLSVVCFLGRLLTWTSSSVELSGILATDNSGLVDQAKEQTKIHFPVPNATFQSNWDVVEAIVLQVEKSRLQVTYQHVKGQQDKDTAYELLPFLAQLNWDADKVAGAYQLLHGSYRPHIPLSPTRPITLDIAGCRIYCHMKTAIGDSAHSGPLLDRMRVRNFWPAYVLGIIDWDTHRLSTMVHRLHRSHFVKLCHGYLPAGKIAPPKNPSFPDFCPLCKTPAKDISTSYNSPHATLQSWQDRLLQQLSNKCNTLKTDPILKTILIQGLSCWLKQIPFDKTGIPERYSQLLQEQQDISWYQFFLACISLQWAHQQDDYLRFCQNKLKGLSGPKWAKRSHTIITAQWIKLWDKRNGDRHGSNSTAKAKVLKEQAIRELTILYTYKDKVLQRHRHIFCQDIKHITFKAIQTTSASGLIPTNWPFSKAPRTQKQNQSLTAFWIISSYFPLHGQIN